MTILFLKKNLIKIGRVKNQSDETYKILKKRLLTLLREREKRFVKEDAANKLIADYDRNGILPVFRDNKYEKERKQDLLNVIKRSLHTA